MPRKRIKNNSIRLKNDAQKRVRSGSKENERLVCALLNWFCANARDLPWRKTPDPYAIWVSEIMLQQTQVKTVIPYWNRWMHELPNIESLANASSEKIHKLWEGLGYYTRVRNMQKAAQMIVEKYEGYFPTEFEEILALPGIGRYTAGAICSIAFNQPTPILDGNVIRVLTRVFGIAGNPRDKKINARLWMLAEKLVRQANDDTSKSIDDRSVLHCSFLNQSLMELGALICTPRQAKCDECPVQSYCVAFREERVAELPNLDQRATATDRRFIAFIVEHEGKFMVQQRPAGVVNAHLWEFPNFEAADDASSSPVPVYFSKITKKPICTIKHSITRYRISLEVYRARIAENQSVTGHWFTLSELDKLAFSSAHRKILNHCSKAGK